MSHPFADTAIQIEIRQLARKFARQKLLPLMEEDEAAARFRPELIAELGDLGLTGIPVGEAHGGAGLGYQEYIGALEELATASAPGAGDTGKIRK
jgi:alkylation response protein AidB-like acyl-CoA dehydrogenase